MEINEHTKTCISVAERPGKFGLRFHNQGYERMGINQIYLPLKVNREDLPGVIQLVRENFKGCSVSMPHKIEVLGYLNEIDRSAETTGACNTILNLGNGKLRGYNTDYFGAKSAIESKIENLNGQKVLMIGAGGVACAVGRVVKDLGGELTISNRTNESAKNLAEALGANCLPWEDRNSSAGYLLINATPIGMGNETACPVDEETISNYNAVMDVVASNKTKLIRTAEENRLITITGKTMTIHQAEKQFEIYTGKKLPADFISTFLNE